MKKITVGVLGATGIVGQRYLSRLYNHPFFDITFLAASPNSAGKNYADAVQTKWNLSDPLPEKLKKLPVYSAQDISKAKRTCSLVFSALSGPDTYSLETDYAKAGMKVISNASAHRMDPDVPMVIPEINPDHIHFISAQQKLRKWKEGFLICKPNCSIQSYLLPLFPLHQHYSIEKVVVTTMQAISGGGYPGVPSLDILGNLIPYIPQEEEKSETEPLKILGNIKQERIELCNHIDFSVHCTRIPVIDGHTASVSVKFTHKPTEQDIINLWKNFQGKPQQLQLPSAPNPLIHYFSDPYRPQPRKDTYLDQGMAVSVGRLKPCSVLDYRFIALSDNTARGAAGGGVLIAELLYKEGLLS